MTGQQSSSGPSGGNIQFEVGRLTGENTRLHLENTRLGEELTRLTDENVRLREENTRLGSGVKRLTDDPLPPLSMTPNPLPAPPPVKRYLYSVGPDYQFSTVRNEFFQFGKGCSLCFRVRTQQGRFLLANEVSPQGDGTRVSYLTFDWPIIDIPGLTFSQEVLFTF